MAEWKKHVGERHGLNWIISRRGKRSRRHLLIDTNFWKSFTHARLSTFPGNSGSMTLFGKRGKQHRLIADHFGASEYKVRVEGRGRKLDEWRQKPGADNHYWDIFCGAACAASVQGCVLTQQEELDAPKKKAPPENIRAHIERQRETLRKKNPESTAKPLHMATPTVRKKLSLRALLEERRKEKR